MTESEQILSLWGHEQSIKAVSRKTGIPEQRVRRILIDNGILPTARAREINSLAGAGMPPEDIATRLHISVDTVNYYLPYKRGMYTGESSTTAWRKSKQED